MNNYPSSNFATVFFLVVLFIGTGVLGYHAFELTKQNGQLNETINVQNAKIESLTQQIAQLTAENQTMKPKNVELKKENSNLMTENTSLKNENSNLKNANADLQTQNSGLQANNNDLKSKVAALTDENGALTTNLEKANAEIASLKTTNSDQLTELEMLSNENSSLKAEYANVQTAQQNTANEIKPAPKALQSSIFPTEIESWMVVGLVALTAVVLFEVVLFARTFKKVRPANSFQRTADGLKRNLNKNGTPRQNLRPTVIDAHFIEQ